MVKPKTLDSEIRFALGSEERAALERLARSHDRTISAEVRYAIRFYTAALRGRKQIIAEAAIAEVVLLCAKAAETGDYSEIAGMLLDGTDAMRRKAEGSL